MLTVGGWFDAEDLFGALETYRSIESQSPGIANRLVMGPWPHGGWSRGTGDALGKVTFGQPTSKFFEEQIELPFFRYYLKGGDDPKLPEAYVFETGANAWHALDAWPPREARPLAFYLSGERPALPGAAFRDGGGLRRVRLRPGEARSVHRGRRHRAWSASTWWRTSASPARRPDVLVYETEPLEEDLTIAGPITASLSVSTTGTDSDWVVKLIDVYPDDYPPQPGETTGDRSRPVRSKMGGYQQLVRGEPFRGKFRKSFEKPEPFVPGAGRRRSSSRCPTSSTPSGGATGSWCRCRAAGSRS